MEQSISQDIADILLKINAVSFRFDPPFTYTSGMKSPIYLDNRIIMSYPEERHTIIDLYIQKITEEIGTGAIDYISATATAAIPQGAWIAERLKLPMVYCRSGKKGHGKENQIEGNFTKGARTLIVEDHISTGGSSVGNAEAIRALGGIVTHCIATSTYETTKSIEVFKSAQITLLTLVTGKEIAKRANETGIMSDEQYAIVIDWFTDPTGWATKQGF